MTELQVDDEDGLEELMKVKKDKHKAVLKKIQGWAFLYSILFVILMW